MTRSVSVRVGLAFVVVLSVLAASAPPVSAMDAQAVDELVVGGQHTDFGTGDEPSPQTVENLSITGGGDSATVEASGRDTIEDFDDTDPLSEWSGDTGSLSTTTNPAISGQAGELTGGGDFPTVTRPLLQNTTDSATYRFYVRSANVNEFTELQFQDANGNIGPDIAIDGGEFKYRNPDGLQSTGVSASDNTFYTVTLDVDVTTDTYNFIVDGTTIGSDLAFTSSVSGLETVAFKSFGTTSHLDEMARGTGIESAQYVSAQYSISGAEQAAINITSLSNASVEATVRTTEGTVLNQTTISGTGNHTLELADSSSDTLETILNVSSTGDNSNFELSDESILFTNHVPEASNLQPSDGADLTEQSVDFSANISDSEFPTAQGDEVTAELFVDNQSVGSETVTSNQTVTITHSLSDGGDHEYYWELEDAYGATTTTTTRTISSPSELYIREETNPESLVTDAQVNITYYYGDEIVRRNSSDGTVDLSGLPIDEPIIALAEADGYHTRTAVVTSIYDQNSLYLLNDSLSSHEVIFDISDPTGEFPRSDTILEVQRDINLNGSTEWRTVAGDVFGAQGVTTDLQAGERYRLVLRNLATGEVASIGAFTPTGSQQITLEPQSASVSVSAESDSAIGYAASRNDAGDAIVVEYTDPNQTTTSLTFMIHERNNESNVLVPNQTYTDLGNLSYSHPLNNSTQNTTWVVEYHWEHADGSSGNALQTVGQGTRDLVPGILDNVWRVSAGVTALFITALLFSQLNVGVGAITTALAAALLWYIGLLSTVTTGPAVVLALTVAGLIHYNRGGGAPS